MKFGSDMCQSALITFERTRPKIKVKSVKIKVKSLFCTFGIKYDFVEIHHAACWRRFELSECFAVK